MKYKAIISDLDGTLLNSEHKISDYTKTVIKSIIDSGVKFFIATGRHHTDVLAIKKVLDLDSIMITSNGARVHDEKNKEILARDLPLSISREIIDLKLNEEIHVNLFAGDNWYTEKEAQWTKEFHTESGFTYTLADFKDLKDTKITKFFYLHENPKIMKKLEKKINELYPNQLNVTMSLPVCLEIMAKNVSKGTAIIEVLKLENIKIEETIAFGDGLNDLEMLGLVGKGFIMGNGSPTLKETLPNLEVIGNNTNDGVAKKLKEIFKI
ncbi:MAG: haloacid dehalogenase [Fusobacteriia bacterium 4572_74]|nr:MAG: haloacid dehalogenase [Fusobacteriia bacterium 4572_74]